MNITILNVLAVHWIVGSIVLGTAVGTRVVTIFVSIEVLFSRASSAGWVEWPGSTIASPGCAAPLLAKGPARALGTPC
jgi:hypothetical protein